MRSVASVCLCVCICASVCPVHALGFERVDLENSFLYTCTCTYSEYLGQVRISRSPDYGQGRGSKKRDIRE